MEHFVADFGKRERKIELSTRIIKLMLTYWDSRKKKKGGLRGHCHAGDNNHDLRTTARLKQQLCCTKGKTSCCEVFVLFTHKESSRLCNCKSSSGWCFKEDWRDSFWNFFLLLFTIQLQVMEKFLHLRKNYILFCLRKEWWNQYKTVSWVVFLYKKTAQAQTGRCKEAAVSYALSLHIEHSSSQLKKNQRNCLIRNRAVYGKLSHKHSL